MKVIKRIIFSPIIAILWLLYVVGDCVLRLLCNVAGIVIPVLVICIVCLAINHNWISIAIIGGSISIAFIFLVLLSKLIFVIRNLI